MFSSPHLNTVKSTYDLDDWQIQLYTLISLTNTIAHTWQYNCLTNAIAFTCLTDTRQAISCFQISNHLKFTSGGNSRVLIWMGAITKLLADCQVEWLQQQDREWMKTASSLLSGVYRVQEWWSDIPAINNSVNMNLVLEEQHIFDSILGRLLSDHTVRNFASHASVFISY